MGWMKFCRHEIRKVQWTGWESELCSTGLDLMWVVYNFNSMWQVILLLIGVHVWYMYARLSAVDSHLWCPLPLSPTLTIGELTALFLHTLYNPHPFQESGVGRRMWARSCQRGGSGFGWIPGYVEKGHVGTFFVFSGGTTPVFLDPCINSISCHLSIRPYILFPPRSCFDLALLLTMGRTCTHYCPFTRSSSCCTTKK